MTTLRKVKTMTVRAVALAACFTVIGVQSSASARDDTGVQDFFAREFGFGAAEPSQSAPVWSDDNPYDRPLVVRPRQRKARVAKVTPVAKGPTPKVSIYEDKTLRRGDAVMTAKGIRIFRGADTLPYRDSDFVAIADSGSLSRDVQKTLTAMDRVSRN